MYPRMLINLDKIRQNASVVMEVCQSRKVDVTGITKGVCGDIKIAEAILQSGVKSLGDTRIQNLKRLENFPCEKWLIRIPMLSEIPLVIRYVDVSLVSEGVTLDWLNKEAIRQNKLHGIILMIDMGDRREGCVDATELQSLISIVVEKPGLYLKGIGTNLGCFGFIQTDQQKMDEFNQIIESLFPEPCTLICSAGNSSGLRWLMETSDVGPVNHFRIGEALMFGRERRDFLQLSESYSDAFVLEAEVVEVKTKPSLPDGTIGRDSFGHTPEFRDQGVHCRVICAVGKQDIVPETLVPIEEDYRILGASFDHMIVEVPNGTVSVGDVLSFEMQYPSVVRAMTGEYVEKVYINRGGTVTNEN
jgi:predicted amino acid racemase